MEVLGGRLAEKDVPQVLDHAIDVLLSEPEIPCATFVSLTNSTTLPKIIEVLKWPTCQHQLGFTRIESQLIEKIAQVKGIKPETFGMYEGKVYFADRWKFADWAEKEGLNVKGAPSRRPTFGP